MSLQDNLASAQATEATAKAAYDAAVTQTAAAQAAIDAAKPHLSVLAEIEAEAAQFEGSAWTNIKALVDKAKALF